MLLLVVRHAIAAEPRSDDPETDAARELTKEGREKMRLSAKGLRRELDSPDVLASSPLVRARQTAEILADAYGGLDVVIADELIPSQPPAALARWLTRHHKQERVAVVGHEPHLSSVVSWLLTGSDRPILHLKKGAACLLEFTGDVGAGRAGLLWALRPSQLRALAG
jgi:phosphohistidine phosphatase